VLGQPDLITIGRLEGLLKHREYAEGGRNDEGHGPQLAEHLLPCVERDTALSGANRYQNGMDTNQMIDRDRDCLVQRVENTTQDSLDGGPCGVTLGHFPE
jgi:hypothetical protein